MRRQFMTMRCVAIAAACTSLCLAQVTIPDGTKLRARLDQPLSSASAEVGQAVELVIAEPVKINNVIAIREGARVTGTVTEAVPKRRMGRAGKLDFSIDRVMAADGEWVPLRYTVHKKSGDSHAIRTGIITAGIAFAFLPAAPVALLIKGKDININKGVSFEVFTDTAHALATGPSTANSVSASAGQAPVNNAGAAVSAAGLASITVTSSAPGAEIEVNGAFMGNTPTTLQLPTGTHQITVRNGPHTWARSLQVTNGSTVSLHANVSSSAPVAQVR
jgi:hypothetical protein